MDTVARGNGGEADTAPLFGRYRLERLIGRGGFATVYRAEYQGEYGFRKPVALKVLRRRLQSVKDDVSAEFLNEARLGASIRDPNLVEFYECGRVGDRLYIAMELVEGPNLAQVLQNLDELSAPVGEQAIRSIAVQTARGLRALHRAKVGGEHINPIHQDMKPGNILLSPEGHAKITDYGIARFAADFYETLGLEGLRGSPLYMSPEQARGEPLTQASDIFSFGSVVAELIVGINPFHATSMEAVLRKVEVADLGDALQKVRNRSPGLAPILETCLKLEPEKRYADGPALVKALEAVEPPRSADDQVGALAQEVYELLDRQMSELTRRPVQVFWGMLDDDDEISVSVAMSLSDRAKRPSTDGGDGESSLDEDEQSAEVLVTGVIPLESMRDQEQRAAEAEATAPDTSELVAAVHRGRSRVWLAVVLGVVLIPLAILVPRWIVPREETRYLVNPDGSVRVDDGSGDAVAEEATPDPDDPYGPPLDAAYTPPSANVPQPAAPPRVKHAPVTRGVRGKDTALSLAVQPRDVYRITLWYRAYPDGEWQQTIVRGGRQGTIELVIPAGPWLTEAATSVEYFVDVEGDGGLSRAGSVEEPYRFRLY